MKGPYRFARGLVRSLGGRTDPGGENSAAAAWSEDLARISREDARVLQVVGLARSGTTILSVGLNAHPEVICLIEPYRAFQSQGSFRYVDDGVEDSYAGPPHELIAELSRRSGLRWVGFKETFRPADHPFPSEPFLVENTGSGAVQATVAIVRDPRDVWVSVLTRFPDSRRTALDRAFPDKWNRFVDWTSDERVVRVRYEDLTADPESAFRTITERLDLRYDPGMARPEGTRGLGDDRAERGGEIAPDSVGRYVDELSPSAAAFIEAFCGDRMESLGYSPGRTVGFVG